MDQLRRGLRALRGRPSWLVFGALFVVMGYFYCDNELPQEGDHKLDGQYQRKIARLDGHYMYLNTLSVGLDFDLDLDNEYAKFGDPLRMGNEPTTEDRNYIYPIGTSVLNLPAFYVAHGLAWTGNLFGADIPMHGYTEWHQRVTFLSSLFAGFFALVFGFLIARRYVSQTAALYAVVIVGLGTHLYYYSVYAPDYPHAWSALAVAVLFWYWDKTRGVFTLRRYSLLGVCVGFAALTRMQEVLFAAIPMVEAAVELVQRGRRRAWRDAAVLLGYGAVATACALVVVSPQLYATKTHFGSIFAVPQGDNYMHWDAPFLWEVLFGSRRGLFIWTPLCYVAVVGLWLAPAPARVLKYACFGGFFAQWWVNGSVHDYWGHWGFGMRRMVDLAVVFVIGAAFVVERLRSFHARHPRFAPHALMACALLPFTCFNMEMGYSNVRGKQDIADAPTTSMNLYRNSLWRMTGRVQDYVGNPFAQPYSTYWSWRHDVPIERFDALFDGGLLYTDHRKLDTPGYRRGASITINEASLAKYALGPWGEVQKHGRRLASWARSGARIVVPLLSWTHITMTFTVKMPPGAGPASVEINGKYQAVLRPTSEFSSQAVVVPDGVLRAGLNELRFSCKGRIPPGCVALHHIRLMFRVPP